MIYKNASVSIKGHILVQKVEIIKNKYLKFGVTSEGVTVNLILSKNEEKAKLIKDILKHSKKEINNKAWEFNCLINITESDTTYISYSFFVEDGKQIDEAIELENKGLDLNQLLAEA